MELDVPTQPSQLSVQVGDSALISKAYIKLLKTYLATNELAPSEAIFAANPTHTGIPAGTVSGAFINEAAYRVADPVQGPTSGLFSLDGTSYFQTLRSYMAHVQMTQHGGSDEIRRTHQQYLEAKAAERKAFKDAVTEYGIAKKADPKNVGKLADWLQTDAGRSYREALSQEEQLSKTLERLQAPDMAIVSQQNNDLDAAAYPMGPKDGYNMSCSVKDRSSDATEQPKKADLTYRPLCQLDSYDTVSRSWVLDYSTDSNSLKSIALDLKGASALTWESLGISPAPSNSTPQSNTEPSSNGVENGSAKNEAPAQTCSSHIIPDNEIEDMSVRLRLTDIQSFDVTRGRWDIPNFRTTAPPLLQDAPEYLKTKIYKTTKVLLAYDLDFVVDLPSQYRNGLKDGEIVSFDSGLLGTLPLILGTDGLLHTRTTHNDAYVNILGVLTELV